MARSPDSTRTHQVGRVLSGLAVVSVFLAAGWLLLPRRLADAFFAGWVALAIGLTMLGAMAAWTGRRSVLWLAALLMAGLSVVSMWSMGTLIAPAAVLLPLSAVVLGWADPCPDEPAAVHDTPTGVRSLLERVSAGVGVVGIGGWLVYAGTFGRTLFARGCARETLDCALTVTNWDAVTLTLLGIGAVGVGGWWLWRQAVLGPPVTSG